MNDIFAVDVFDGVEDLPDDGDGGGFFEWAVDNHERGQISSGEEFFDQEDVFGRLEDLF